MSALLDTHALLWWIATDERLSRRARQLIARTDTLVSVVSLWEIEIKRSIGRLRSDTSAILDEVTLTEGMSVLDLRPSHVVSLADLPKHHRDPFDRMLIAQAVREDATIVTNDTRFKAYPVKVVW